MSRPVLGLPDPLASRLPDPSAAGGSGDRERLAQLAAEFESMLLLEMIKQMRVSMLDEDSETEGLGADTFSSTIDSELARHLSRAGGLGLQQGMLDAWDRQRGVTDVEGRPPVELPVAASAAASVGRPATVSAPVPSPDGDEVLRLEMRDRVSSGFGWRRDPIHGGSRFHGGIDLAARYGTEVPAAAAGTVIAAGEQGAYGLTVVVRHAGGYESRYAHLSSLDVAPGDTVAQGTALGRVGSTGRSTAPHLHFEVTQRGERIDPGPFVRNFTGDIKGQ